MTPSTLASLERRLAQLPPDGHPRRCAVDALGDDIALHYAGSVIKRGKAVRLDIAGIAAHGVGVDGALRNWCSVARGA